LTTVHSVLALKMQEYVSGKNVKICIFFYIYTKSWCYLLSHCFLHILFMQIEWKMCLCQCNANLLRHCISQKHTSKDGPVGGRIQGRILVLDAHYPSISEHLAVSHAHIGHK